MWKGSWGVLGLWGVSGQNRSDGFAKPVWPVSPACVRLSLIEAVWSVSETGLTGLGCQQPGHVCFHCVCGVAVGWVLLLGSVAVQWLRELGKRSLWRCTSEIGFIGRILNRIFIGSHSLPPLWFAVSVLHPPARLRSRLRPQKGRRWAPSHLLAVPEPSPGEASPESRPNRRRPTPRTQLQGSFFFQGPGRELGIGLQDFKSI
jgi:hypothetical protein